MAMASSSIEWTEATWNPTTGCDRLSAGCDHCYALTLANRLKAMGQPKYQRDGDPRTSGPGFAVTTHDQELDQPLRWRKPRRVFVNSMSDLFHADIPDEFIARVFAVMSIASQHTYQILTKRPQRMAQLLASPAFLGLVRLHQGSASETLEWPLPNVWLGTSIENDRYSWRANHLRATPAAIRFLSLEPLIGDVPSLDMTGLDWIIVGGESGHEARPMLLKWVRSLRKNARAANVKFFVKQLGTSWAVNNAHGRTHGVDWSQWPADLRVREYPDDLEVELSSVS
jgi:protein gp37